MPSLRRERERASTDVSSSIFKGSNLILGPPPSGPHLSLINFQRPYLQIPSHQGLGFQHESLRGRFHIATSLLHCSVICCSPRSHQAGLLGAIQVRAWELGHRVQRRATDSPSKPGSGQSFFCSRLLPRPQGTWLLILLCKPPN